MLSVFLSNYFFRSGSSTQTERLLQGGARIVNGDLRKFCEQHGDIIQWDQSNKNYIMTHGVSGVDWRFYKHPLPEHVYADSCNAGLIASKGCTILACLSHLLNGRWHP
jgi:hypothetical protein